MRRDKTMRAILITWAIGMFMLFGPWLYVAVDEALAAGVGPDRNPLPITKSGTVTTSLTSIGTVRLGGRYPYITVTVKNTGSTNALVDFKVRVRSSRNGDWCDLLSSTDWADASVLGPDDWSGLDDQGNGHYVYQLAAGEYAHLRIFVGAVDEVDFQADAAATTTTVTVLGYAH